MYDDYDFDGYERNVDEEAYCMSGCSVACGVCVSVGGGKGMEVVNGHEDA